MKKTEGVLLNSLPRLKKDVCNKPTSWINATQPKIDYINDGSEGGKLFEKTMPNLKESIYDINMKVAKLLYKSYEEVPHFDRLILKIEDYDGVAYKTGEKDDITIVLSSSYLKNYKGDIKEEIYGVLTHELTHAYQHTEIDGAALEGIADLCRYLAGYMPLESRRVGGNYNDAYRTTGFFFDWIKSRNVNLLYDLNQAANSNNDIGFSWNETIEKLTGEKVDDLWSEYQKDLQVNGIKAATSK